MAGESSGNRYTLDRVVRLLLSVAGVVAVLALVRHLSDVLLPFAAAVVLAYLLNPLVTALERRTGRRGFAVALTIGGLGIAGAAVVALLVPLVLWQVDRFGDDLRTLVDDLRWKAPADASSQASPSEGEKSEEGGERSLFGFRELKSGWERYLGDAPHAARAERLRRLKADLTGTYLGTALDRVISYTGTEEFNQFLVTMAKRVLAGGWTVVTVLVNAVLGAIGLIVVLLYLVFLLLDFPEYARTWPTFLPPSYRPTIVEFIGQFQQALRRYFRGQAVVSLSTGLLFAVGFSVMGLPMAVPFGLFVGLLNMVPYLQAVGLVPAMMLAGMRSLEGDSSLLASVLLTLLVFGVVQLIQETLIAPRVLGEATGLRPLAILLGVFIWGKLLGFLGLLLAIPLTCLGIAYYRRFVLLHAASPSST